MRRKGEVRLHFGGLERQFIGSVCVLQIAAFGKVFLTKEQGLKPRFRPSVGEEKVFSMSFKRRNYSRMVAVDLLCRIGAPWVTRLEYINKGWGACGCYSGS